MDDTICYLRRMSPNNPRQNLNIGSFPSFIKGLDSGGNFDAIIPKFQFILGHESSSNFSAP